MGSARPLLRLRRLVEGLVTPAEPEPLAVLAGGRSVSVTLRRRQAAKRMTLRVSAATGEVVVTVPDQVGLRPVRAFLNNQAEWIAVRLARLPEQIAFQPGAVVPVRGVPHLLVHEPGRRRTVLLRDGETDPTLVVVGGEPEVVPGRVRRFLGGEAERDLRAASGRHAAALGVSFARIALRDTRSRWGSCSSGGTLSFSWRLILAPPFVLDYLAAHEVAHLREMNHSQRFWRLVHQAAPRTDEAERWLNRHGGALHRYG